MNKKPLFTLLLVLLSLSALTTTLTVKAAVPVSIHILDPNSQTYGNKGLSLSGYWVGEIPITITDGSSNTVQTISYCMDFDRIIYIGGTYPSTIAPGADDEEWRAISYMLTWNYPTTDDEAAAAQVAVWRLLNQTRGTDYYRESWLSPAIDEAGDAIAAQAYGKDVVRHDDQFSWLSPVAANMSSIPADAGETVTFEAKLTKADSTPRADVRVLFNASLNIAGETQPLSASYLSSEEAFTDSEGVVQVSVTVPDDTPLGSTLAVQASTRSLWAQRYIDINEELTQDLLGIGDEFELTLSTDVCILGYITVLPESPLGALAALGAVAAGFVVWKKVKAKKS